MISSKVLIPIIVGVACILALIVGSNLAVEPDKTMVFTGLLALVFVLMVFAREYWWLAMFIAVGFGGFAYFGFKIYAHECMLAIAMAGLLPSLALNPHSEFNTRPRLPWFFYAAGLYLGFQIFYSVAFNSPHGFIEIGNIVRAYTNGLWPLMFVFLFRFYGRSDYLPFALWLLQGIYLLRALMTLATIFLPYNISMMLPGINFMLPGNSANGGGLDDLRFSGHGICLIACATLLGRPSLPVKLLQCVLILFAFYVQAISGGRLLFVASILAVIASLLAARMWKTLITGTVAAGIIVLFLNLYPQFIYNFSPRIQRAISILIFDTYSTEASYMTVGSDLWHQRLTEIGYERWTSSPRTFLIGTGIKPWDARILRETSPTRLFEGQLNGAADTGGYESGLWGILAPAGLVGLLLYVSVIGYFVIPNALRLYRGKLHGIQLTIIFLGTYPALEWALFCFRAGGYPAIELLLATTAFYYMHDHNSRELEAPADVAVDDGSTYAGARDSWA